MRRALMRWPLCAAFVMPLACDVVSEDPDSEDTAAGTDDGGESAASMSASNGGPASGSDSNGSGSASHGGGTDGGQSSDGGEGQSGTDGETVPSICRFTCLADTDCTLDGRDLGFTCEENGRCLFGCTEVSECYPVASSWHEVSCTSSEGCEDGPCMDMGNGEGGCAVSPSEEVVCEDFGRVEMSLPSIEGDVVAVCVNDQIQCGDNGTCSGLPDDCNIEGCVDGFQCAADGRCSCLTDQACIEAGRGDTCTPSGGCVTICETVDECPAVTAAFDGGQATCE